jgi:hypothetical protein
LSKGRSEGKQPQNLKPPPGAGRREVKEKGKKGRKENINV